MPEIELNEEEQLDIQEYIENIRGLSSQINNLVTQRSRLIKAVNTTWKSAYRRAMLEDQLPKDCSVPELIDYEDGSLGIQLDKRIASWAE